MATAAAPQAPPDVTNEDLVRFETALQTRYPGRVIKRYEMPSNVAQARAVYILELTSRDELEAAKMADAVMSQIERSSNRLAAARERTEMMRASVVGLVTRKPLGYRHVNHDGIPFVELDTWPAKATTAVAAFYGDCNGINTAELGEGIMGARTIGATTPPNPAPPTTGTQP